MTGEKAPTTQFQNTETRLQIQNNVAASALDGHRNDVFISYSRRDQQFVRALEAAFVRLNRDPWVDWDDIQKGENWWKAIQKGIEAANAFVFVISPDSVSSSVCRDEIEHAQKCNKRFLPIVYREGFEADQVHPAISSHNWLFFRETEDFNTAFQELIKAIDTDIDYVHAHTRLLVRAIEWQNKDRDQSYLLRGIDSAEAEQWWVQSASKQPKPTGLQADFIAASRAAEAAKRKARQRAKWIVGLTTIVGNTMLTALGCGWFYSSAIDNAKQQIQSEMENALNMGLININGDDFAALARLKPANNKVLKSNSLYQDHQDWLLKVNHVFSKARPRTYIRAVTPGQLLWVGDATRDLKTARETTDFLEPYSADHQELEVYNGKRTIIMEPYKDELGNWVSASAPIQTAAGAVVGGMRVDFLEDDLYEAERSAVHSMTLAFVIVLLWLIASSAIILYATRPLDETRSKQ